MGSERLIDLAGHRFTRLLVIAFSGRRSSATWWKCKCDCGKEFDVRGGSIRSGQAKSCGCLSRDRAATLSKTHGMSNRSEYKIWLGIKKRCENPICPAYRHYGGRGIYLAEEFQDFERFLAHVGPRPNNTSLDRIDNNGPYAPGNVRWTTRKVQARNSRHNHLLTYNGKTQPISAWAEELGFKKNTIGARLKYGWPVEMALTEPVRVGAF